MPTPTAPSSELLQWRQQDRAWCVQAASWATAWGLHWQEDKAFKLADVAHAPLWEQARSVFAGRVLPLKSERLGLSHAPTSRTGRQLSRYAEQEQLDLVHKPHWCGKQDAADLALWCDQESGPARRIAIGWTLSMALFGEAARQTDEMGDLNPKQWHSRQQWITPMVLPELARFAIDWATQHPANAVVMLGCIARLKLQHSGANLITSWILTQNGPLSDLWALAKDQETAPWSNPLSAWLLETPWWGLQAVRHWGPPSAETALKGFNQRNRAEIGLEEVWSAVVNTGEGVRLGPVSKNRNGEIVVNCAEHGLIELAPGMLSVLKDPQQWDNQLWAWARPAIERLQSAPDVLIVNEWVGRSVLSGSHRIEAIEDLAHGRLPLSGDKKITWLWHTAALRAIRERAQAKTANEAVAGLQELRGLVKVIALRNGRSLKAMLPTSWGRSISGSLAMEAVFAGDEEALTVLIDAGASPVKAAAFWTTRRLRLAHLNGLVGMSDRQQRELAMEKALSFWQRLSMQTDWIKREKLRQKKAAPSGAGAKEQGSAEDGARESGTTTMGSGKTRRL